MDMERPPLHLLTLESSSPGPSTPPRLATVSHSDHPKLDKRTLVLYPMIQRMTTVPPQELLWSAVKGWTASTITTYQSQLVAMDPDPKVFTDDQHLFKFFQTLKVNQVAKAVGLDIDLHPILQYFRGLPGQKDREDKGS
ncbi:hypothetical protein BG003_008872 [Podila horticola]|nr:hypothetical protein BG003_008872 [Podila horticola]